MVMRLHITKLATRVRLLPIFAASGLLCSRPTPSFAGVEPKIDVCRDGRLPPLSSLSMEEVSQLLKILDKLTESEKGFDAVAIADQLSRTNVNDESIDSGTGFSTKELVLLMKSFFMPKRPSWGPYTGKLPGGGEYMLDVLEYGPDIVGNVKQDGRYIDGFIRAYIPSNYPHTRIVGVQPGNREHTFILFYSDGTKKLLDVAAELVRVDNDSRYKGGRVNCLP